MEAKKIPEDEAYDPMRKWLEEYGKPKVAKANRARFLKFLKWSKKTPKELVDQFDQKEARNLILRYQTDLMKKYKANTVRSLVNSVRAFYASRCETVRGLKRKIVKAESARGQHVFSTADLKKMFHIANTRDKAILACGCSLGWGSSAFLDMNRDYFEKLVKRARSQNEEFITFEWIRPKTQNEIFGILTPCALDSLERYLEKTQDNPSPKLWNGITSDTLTDILRKLAKEANVVVTGSVSWHLLRKWLMQTLTNANIDVYGTKLMIGKGIPITDKTYLQTLKKKTFEKVKSIYAFHLSLVAYSNGNHKADRLAEVVRLLFTTAKDQGLLRKVDPNTLSEMEVIIKKANGETEEKKQDED